jgi:hypothetical protein
MERKIEKIICTSLASMPTIEQIQTIPRNIQLILEFGGNIVKQRENFGNQLKEQLNNFQVDISEQAPLINIAKLITDEEIEANQDFFEKCAKDYGMLAKKLIFELASAFNLSINKYPWLTFNPLKRELEKQRGKMGDWNFYLHGIHCAFENKKTGQYIEVLLVFGHEFGDLDPYFFSLYIKSTKEYQPLPTEIFEDYADGKRIIERMLTLGKFEKINSNISHHYGVAVTDRYKTPIDTYDA